VPGANHFLNDGPASMLLGQLEQCIPNSRPTWRWPSLITRDELSIAQLA
jgi:hypothetical protein